MAHSPNATTKNTTQRDDNDVQSYTQKCIIQLEVKHFSFTFTFNCQQNGFCYDWNSITRTHINIEKDTLSQKGVISLFRTKNTIQ